MKRSILFSTIIVALLSSCTAFEPTASQSVAEGDLVRFSAVTELGTKVLIAMGEEAPVLTWEEDDQVGIFDRAEDSSRNYCYDVNPLEGSTESTLVANDVTKAFFSKKGEKQTFFSYYPYQKDVKEMAVEFPLSLSKVQTQDVDGGIGHLKEHNFMMGSPVELDGGAANISFASVFSIVKFTIGLKEDVEVPVKQLRLKSTSSPLAMESGVIDLTTDGSIVAVVPDNNLTLAFESNVAISSSESKVGYLLVLPGSHAAGELSLDVVAVDNSIATIELPAVTFKGNCYYEQTIELSIDEFVQATPFRVEIESLSGKVGEPVHFIFSGIADAINLFTGENGHDYKWKDQERFDSEDLVMWYTSAYASGNDASVHDDLFKLKVSADFSGVYTEEDILAATWTDITDLVNMPMTTMANWNENVVESGEVNLTPYLPNNKTLYIGMFYHVEPYDTTLANGRTIVYILDFYVKSRAASGEETDIIVDTISGSGDINLIIGESYEGDAKHPEFKNDTKYGYGNYFRLWSEFQPKTDRYAYMVTRAVSPNYTSLGTDTPVVIQSATDSPVSEYSYTFNEAGVYNVVIEAYTTNILGETTEIVKEFVVTIE